MVCFVIGIIFAIVGLVLFVGFISEDKRIAAFRLLFVGLFLGIVLCIIGCIKTVPTGSTGVVTTFGKIENYTLDAGVHFMSPWKKVIRMDNRTQKQTLKMSCFSSDIQEVNVAYTINYQINKSNAQEIYKNIGVEYFDKIVHPKALESVKSVMAKYNASSLIVSRADLSAQIEEILRNDLKDYNIEIVSTSLENIDFTDAFTNAVEAAQVATQNKIKAQTEQEQANLEAQAQAERQVIKAQADADSAKIAAQNDAEIAKIAADSAEYQGQKDAAIMSNLGTMLQRYPELVKYYYVTGWDGKMPETILGDDSNLMYSIK